MRDYSPRKDDRRDRDRDYDRERDYDRDSRRDRDRDRSRSPDTRYVEKVPVAGHGHGMDRLTRFAVTGIGT